MASILGDSGATRLVISSVSSTSTTPVTTTSQHDVTSKYSWLVPTVVSVICLVFVTLCIVGFVLYSRRRATRYRIRLQEGNKREQSFDDWARTRTGQPQAEGVGGSPVLISRTTKCVWKRYASHPKTN